jgi:hypothetical protein
MQRIGRCWLLSGPLGPAPLKPVAAWVTAHSYVVGPPADFVTNGGSSYECLVAHTSGTFATDLAAGKWGLVSSKGADALTYGGSSATSLAIAVGSKDFTDVPLTLAYQIGNYVRASSAASGANYIEGFLTAYSAGHFTINVQKIGGSGTHTDWNFSIAGAPGSGDMFSTNFGSEYVGHEAAVAANLGVVSYAASQALTAAQRTQARTNINAPLRGHLFGLTLSTAGSSATFGVAAGECADSTSVDLLVLSSAYTKTTSAWAVGSGNGALDTGTIAANTWYHVYSIKRPDTGVVDICVSLSVTTPNLTTGNIPTAYTLPRRIGSMKTDASSHWVLFHQSGDEFLWDVPFQDLNGVAPGTTGQLVTLNVPLSIQVNVIGYGQWYNTSTTAYLYISSPDVNNAAAAGTLATAHAGGSVEGASVYVGHRTNTSSQIRIRADAGGGALVVNTHGWIDNRGRQL